MMSELIIESQSLHRSFGRTAVLKGIDLSIQRGMVVGLLGVNGSGKSTLIKCLLGLLRVSAGQARVFGEDPWVLSGAAKARLGYVPQDVKLYPWMTVSQVIGYTAAFYPKWDFALSEKLISRWDLDRNHRVGPLSPGQLQKLGLILALGHRPDLLILDEPVAALDPVARREFLKSLLEVTQDEQHTVLFSTHITSDLERVASHVALLKEGRLALFEDLDAIKYRVKRLRISTTTPLPHSFSVTGALRTEVTGQTALVAATNVSDRMVSDLRSQWDAEVAVEDLNLEEIFLELHQDPDRRPGL